MSHIHFPTIFFLQTVGSNILRLAIYALMPTMADNGVSYCMVSGMGRGWLTSPKSDGNRK
jgi:aryl-alcohol dehydrogenase-like predicted oxidoreductase